MKTVLIASIAILMALSGLATTLTMMQPAHAVCSSDGRCSNPDGSRIGSGGASITACINHTRTLTSSDGRTLTQSC